MIEAIERPTEKLYSARTIACATFLGGPLAAGYLISKNYFSLGEDEAGKKSIIYGFTATSILFILLIFFFEEAIEDVPSYVLPLIQALIVFWIVKREQGSFIEEHLQSGGRKASWWGALGIAIASLVATLLIVIAIQGYKPDDYARITFGKMDHQIAYDDKVLQRAEVRKVAHVLGDHGFFDSYSRMFIQVEQNKWSYKVMIEADPDAFNDSEVLDYLRNIQNGLDTVSLEKKIKLVLYYDLGEERITKNF